MVPLTQAQVRHLKSQGQRLKATLKLGKDGLSAAFAAMLNEELKRHELVKVKLVQFKDQKDDLAAKMAEVSASHLVTRIGHVVLLYRPKPEEAK